MKTRSKLRSTSKRFTPSPSMVVAVMALIVALSGSAYAAATINGKNIKKGTVTTKQVKNKSLTGTDIKDGSVLGADVKDSSLTGTDVADGSIGASDLASGVVPTFTPAPVGSATTASNYAVPLASPSDIPGMSIDYTVPAGANKIVASFSGDCTISTTIDDQYAAVRILVDGVDANPTGYLKFCGPGDDDGPTNTGSAGKATYTSGSVTKTIAATPGTHTIKVQGLQILAASATLDNMTLVVQSGS